MSNNITHSNLLKLVTNARIMLIEPGFFLTVPASWNSSAGALETAPIPIELNAKEVFFDNGEHWAFSSALIIPCRITVGSRVRLYVETTDD